MCRSAGKTGTTQSYRDAWYVGYTGNYTAAVWLGNDDYSPTRHMTGGSLPAMVWQRVMSYAHQNIDLKPIPGIENPLPDMSDEKEVAEDGETIPGPERPLLMSSRTTDLLKDLSQAFRDAPEISPSIGVEKLSAL
jgi:penicillin-binding protein 1A